MAHTLDDVLRVADDPKVQNSIVHFLTHLMAVDTTVGPDLERVREHEEQALDLCAQAAETFLGTAHGIERVPIDPRIEADPYYTPAHYTKTAERPEGLGAADAYRGRSNLAVRVPGQGRGVLAFNAHVDVVAPYIEPRVEGGVVYGRGACDDKAQCAVMLLALYLIEHARWMCGLLPPADLLFEFVIDEEPGGNGSLSLALDRRFAFDALVVLEATKLALHPGNRGAVWYRLELDGNAASGPCAHGGAITDFEKSEMHGHAERGGVGVVVPARDAPAAGGGRAAGAAITDFEKSEMHGHAERGGVDVVGLAAAVVLALEKEGAAIKAESNHPLFPHRPVQTCHGILGPWGKHPSAVNDHVEIAFRFDGNARRIRDAVGEAVRAYCTVYGDKTKEADPETGRPKVDHHCDLMVDGQSARLIFHGKAGHMGAIVRCDDAITKAAYAIQALEAIGASSFALGSAGPATLVLEGGQGFLPTHSLDEVTARMRRAVAEAAEAYCREKRGHSAFSCEKVECPLFSMTFDKLHNDAFARDPDSPGVRAFVECCRAVGIPVEEPLRGWDVSCDARVFAREYPGRDIITFGAGALEHAHSAQEQVRVADIVAAAKAIARFALTYEPEARET